MDWSLEEAIVLIKNIEAICPQYNCHVALTGGLLYKEGRRKDLDIIFYAVGSIPPVDIQWTGLIQDLKYLGLTNFKSLGRVTKAYYEGKAIDIIDPTIEGDYLENET